MAASISINRYFILSFVISFVSIGCGDKMAKVKKARMVKIGMSKQQVIQIMGNLIHIKNIKMQLLMFGIGKKLIIMTYPGFYLQKI